jgi:hypothetical protein
VAPPKPSAPAACEAAHLDACERRLTAVADAPPARELAAAYIAARAERDPADAWARLFRDLDRPPHPAVAILSDVLPTPKYADHVQAIAVAALPKPAAASEEDLLLALAGAAGYAHVVRFRDTKVTQLFPADPLAPFMAGLPPVVRDDTVHLESDLAIAASLRTAFEHAGASRYLEAAREADRLDALVASRDPLAEPVLRARYALQLLGNAGLVLDAPEAPGNSSNSSNDAPASPLPEAGPPAATDTPYGDLLRIETAKDSRKAWEIRGAKVIAGIPADRRDDLAALWARPKECDAKGRPPPMEGLRDLVYLNKLSGALIRDKASEARGEAAGLLPLPEWLRRYQTAVDLVEKSHVGWSYTTSLLQQRGEAFGLSPVGTSTYRRVTDLGLSHLGAARALEQAEPQRFRAMAQLGFAYSPGAVFDDRLREALIRLTEAAVQDKVAASKDASGVFGGLLTGVLTGLSYPAAVQQAHYQALQGAVAAKLHGDLLMQTGWGVAGLYALDAAYRVVADQGPNLDFSSKQIARTLGDPGLAYPALGALATAAARYAALAANKKLDPEAKPDRFPPERKEARAALRSALAGLGAAGEAPNNVLDDVTDLADGLIATLSTALADGKSPAPPPPPKPAKGKKRAAEPAAEECQSKAAVTLTPSTRRALAKLGDVRRRILGHPRYTKGDGAWVRRTRMLVTVLSDAMDLALKEDKKLSFTVPAEDAEKALGEGLREWDERAAADAIAGTYALARGLGTAEDVDRYLAGNGKHLRRVIKGLIDFFRSDSGGGKGPDMGVALLDTVAKLGLDRKADLGDLRQTLLSFAKAFYESGKPDQGDLWMLGTMVLCAATQTLPAPEALELAAKHQSRVDWALRFLSEVSLAKRDRVPDPASYADAIRKATDDGCQKPGADDTISVVQAAHDFANGKRSEARAALDKLLDKADAEGLRIPKMSYRYEEKTATKVFALTLDVSYGAGVLSGANSFQVGLGMRTKGEPEGLLTATLAPPDTAKAVEEAARYYVYTAALATVYHLLENDEARAAGTGRRVVGALTAGLRLGSKTQRGDKPASLGTDARALIAVAAQLAGEASMPFLSGDLWTVLRQGLSSDADDKSIAGVLDPLPLGLAGMKELKAVADRAGKSLKVVAAPLACTTAKVELGGYEEPGCDGYPIALSLRVAGLLKKLPRLKHGSDGPRCGSMRSLDGFLASVDRGAYDPDAFTKAAEDLRADGHLYDAAALLTRQRRDSHCSGGIVAAARSLGRTAALGPQVRSDLLSVALNCAIATGGADVAADLLALDDATRKLADPAPNLKVLLSIADLGVRTDQWGLLARLTEQPEFVERWMSIHPTAATGALVLEHAAAAIEGGAVNLEKTRAAYELLCETFPPGDRADACSDVKALRAPLKGPMAERQRLAKEAVKRQMAVFIGAPRK